MSVAASSLPVLAQSTYVPVFSHQPQLHPFANPSPSLAPQSPTLSPRFRQPITPPRCRRRDSNAGDEDDFGRQRRRWWYDYSPVEVDRGPGILEEFVDSIWIVKVFGSYFPLLPAFLLSMLLATGPTAFFLSLAFLILQSAFIFATKKLLDDLENNPKRKSKSKKKAHVNDTSNFEFKEEESKWTQKGKKGYRSMVDGDNFSVNEDHQNPSTFGGWDDLVEAEEFDMKYSRKSAVKGKFSREERKRATPLLLRLLVAVFPFLGSWIKTL